MGIQLMGDISCLLRLLWPRSSMGSASCAWLLTLRLVKIAVKWTLDFLGGSGHSPVSLLTQSLPGPEVSSDRGGSWSFWKPQLSRQGRSIVSAPSPEDGLFLIFFFSCFLSQRFLPSDNFADKFSPSYWAVVPSFLNTFLWKVVCFNSFDVEGYLR